MLDRLKFLALALLLASCVTRPLVPRPEPSKTPEPSPTAKLPPVESSSPSIKVGAFYYPWYGTPSFDRAWVHWTQNGHTPPEDIASDYYPALGAYSSSDPVVIAQHMNWLRQAGVGVIIVSWWGKDSVTDRAIPLILQIAEKYGIKVTFHIEPYSGRSAAGLVDDIKYLYKQYGNSPAFFRSTSRSSYSSSQQPKGMFFVWCIQSPGTCGDQLVTPGYWQKALDEIHTLSEPTLLIANSTDVDSISGGQFDGLYNYSTLHLSGQGGYFDWAGTLPPGALYVPSVIPGFSAKRVGYSADTYVPRDDGSTYNAQWTDALGAGLVPDMVTITSFNEWHEGTMIEPPAFDKSDGRGYTYADFGSLPADGYLTLTRKWVQQYAATTAPVAYHARIQIGTTSDWTTLNLTGGSRWIRPVLVNASETATQAGFEAGGRLILAQAMTDATQGQQVQMTLDLDLTGFSLGDTISLQVDRGNVGKTNVVLLVYRGNDPVAVASFLSDQTGGERNRRVFSLAASDIINPVP